MAQNTLKTVPAELRNNIYDLVFAPDEKGSAVDLRDTRPPTKAILLVCRQFYNETGQMYRTAFQTYWRSTPFVLDFGEEAASTSDKDIISRLDASNVEQITNLQILTSPFEITWDAATRKWLCHRFEGYWCRVVVKKRKDDGMFNGWCLCFGEAEDDELYEHPSLKEQVQYYMGQT